MKHERKKKCNLLRNIDVLKFKLNNFPYLMTFLIYNEINKNKTQFQKPKMCTSKLNHMYIIRKFFFIDFSYFFECFIQFFFKCTFVKF